MTTIRITTPYYKGWVEFGLDGKPVRTDPILGWVKQQGWDQDRLWSWARGLGYEAEIVHD